MVEKGKEEATEPGLCGEGIHITKRLREAIRLFNSWNYLARWEAHADSPHIIFGNCPYLSILPSHPELCYLDRYMIETLVGSPAEQVAKRTPDKAEYLFAVPAEGRVIKLSSRNSGFLKTRFNPVKKLT
jgi:predicted ArsR family transcriptional regulator